MLNNMNEYSMFKCYHYVALVSNAAKQSHCNSTYYLPIHIINLRLIKPL